ncbi:DUF3558 domain-containing protein [Saccharomonospora piscinae]|uniref:DUF3558 domain-containing protein n=1 Tax=Saccharomonospora piscinae TaxID=687388 RepID=UPI00110594DC|nr:DUF3558 domain-containing protein [Saccharomonospora piscinae]
MLRKLQPQLFMVGVLPLLICSGCASGEQGFAQPKTPMATSSSGTTTTGLSSAAPVSASIDPCDLLSSEDLAEAGNFEPKYDEGGGARSCYWQRSGADGGDGFTFAVNVRDAQSVDTVKDLGAGLVNLEVNERPAVISKKPKFGDCTLALKLDEQSRVDVAIPGEDETDEACEVAETIAGMIEPRLPGIP